MASPDPTVLTSFPAGGTAPGGAPAAPRRLGKQTIWLALVALCLLWCYWPTLLTMADRWSNESQYSHGFLVPLFAGVVLWHRRLCMPASLRPSWWGLAVLFITAAIRLMAAYKGFEPLDAFTLLPALTGLCLLLAGWPALRWSWPAIAFLGFMLPLPFTIETMLARPLQRLATVASTFSLQTLGFPAVSEGNIIYIDDVQLGVLDACNGLGMLMTFFALATAMAIVIQRRLADKLIIVASAIPIAVIANVTRISATGVAHCIWGAPAGAFLHDWAGWLMMPLALVLLWLELLYLDRLLVGADDSAPLAIDFRGAARALPYPRKDAQPLSCEPRSPAAMPLESPTISTHSGR
jgi:exosortase